MSNINSHEEYRLMDDAVFTNLRNVSWNSPLNTCRHTFQFAFMTLNHELGDKATVDDLVNHLIQNAGHSVYAMYYSRDAIQTCLTLIMYMQRLIELGYDANELAYEIEHFDTSDICA